MTTPRRRVGLDSFGRPVTRTDPIHLVLARVERRADGCLLFLGCRNARGYGRTWVGLAHRIVWAHHHPENPSPPVVMHTCDVPACVEISHLRAGTPAENMADMVAKGRSSRQYGEANPRTKLSDIQVASIRARRAAGETLAALAVEHRVHPAYLSRLTRGLRRSV